MCSGELGGGLKGDEIYVGGHFSLSEHGGEGVSGIWDKSASLFTQAGSDQGTMHFLIKRLTFY